MAHVCGNCDFFDGSGTYTSRCPSCDGNMRFTLLDPRGTATATLDRPDDGPAEQPSEPPRGRSPRSSTKPAWHDPYAYGYEEIEAPWEFRYAQIGAGIGAYFFVWRWGQRLITLLVVTSPDGPPKGKELMAMGVGILVLNCAAALAGGGAAGMWAKNWIVQGLGVAVGVLAIPLVGMMIFAPESWPLFCVTLAATSVLTMVGAFLGHLIVKPTRIANS
jgi:hypothetical protein